MSLRAFPAKWNRFADGHSDSSSHPCNFKVVCFYLQATDIQEMVLQSLFVQSQMKVLAEQVKDLGETVSKSAMDSMKRFKKG